MWGEVWGVLGSDRLARHACCELGRKARVRFSGLVYEIRWLGW